MEDVVTGIEVGYGGCGRREGQRERER